MTSAIAIFRDMLKSQIGPMIREHGFRGTAPTWQIRSAYGDYGSVNFQSSSETTHEQVLFYINLGYTPQAWFDFQSNTTGGKPKRGYEFLKDRLYTDDEPRALENQRWSITDHESAIETARRVTDRLNQVGLPQINSWLDPSNRIKQLTTFNSDLARVLILTDCGPSSELDDAIKALKTGPLSDRQPLVDQVVRWVQERTVNS
ncbi:hypothetical protein CVV68_01410 [Arthrobacter livingstonensis]|uniref:DUF4304 domain-containing protein n=2 Tax=Arthrobacter livingstonensis TaxID=670078 RepID=A0A2V5LG15_9MICC|nr:hypothetical protein CVV68_01410 [Arthrobacter livingstonensis]